MEPKYYLIHGGDPGESGIWRRDAKRDVLVVSAARLGASWWRIIGSDDATIERIAKRFEVES